MRHVSIVAAALLLLGTTPALAAEANVTIGPLCIELANKLGIAQSMVASFIPQLPTPPSADFCSWLAAQNAPCDTISLLEFGLIGDVNAQPNCTFNGTGPQNIPEGVIKPFQDRRPLPAAFPDAQAVLEAEGSAYHALYNWHSNFFTWVPCAYTNPAAAMLLPSGWQVLTMANISQPEDVELPGVMIVSNTSQLIIIPRGTESGSEWARDFAFNQTNDPAITSMFGGSPIHSGLAGMFTQVWPAVRDTLDSAVVAKGASAPEVYVTGQSLGGALGTLISYAAQDYLDTKMGTAAPLISAVLFTPFQVGPAAFADAFDKKVNARRLAFSNDLIQQVPCSPSMPACPAKPDGLLGAMGVTAVPTNTNNVSFWNYTTIGGTIGFNASEMPQDTYTWEQIQDIPLCWAGDYIQASHVCSYACMTSQYVSPPVNNTWCWLGPNKPSNAAGTYCPGFPVTGLWDAAPSPASAPATPVTPSSPVAKAPSPSPSGGGVSATSGAKACLPPMALLLAALFAALVVLA